MIKHIVLWRLKDEGDGRDKRANALLIKEKLESMRGKIPGMLKVEVGINFEANGEASDVALYAEFESRAALQGYQGHPEHTAFKDFIKNVRSERRVVDYEVLVRADLQTRSSPT
jgi:hypothetical protein